MNRILVFCSGSKVSGVEIITLNLLLELTKIHYEVLCIINGWNDGEFKHRLIEAGIPFKEIKLGFIYLKKPTWTASTLAHYPYAALSIKRIIGSFAPDSILHMSYKSLLMTLPILPNNNILHAHDNIPPTWITKRLFSLIARKTSTFIAVSETVKQNLKDNGIPSAKITTIYNGISLNSPPLKRHSKRKNEAISIGIVGQVTRRKGHHLVFEALTKIVSLNKSLTLMIYGSGDRNYIDDLKDFVKNHQLTNIVQWKGFYKNQRTIYQEIDLIIVATIDSEPFGLIAIEAGVNDVLVISSDAGGLTEIITDGYNGYLFKANSSDDLTAVLRKALSEPGRWQLLKSNHHDRIIRKFTLTEQVKKIDTVLKANICQVN